jgi:excinuclease ABC subunit C
MFLSGKSREIVHRLQEKMKKLSEELRYEDAAKIRDQLKAIESATQRQRVVSYDMIDRDIIAVAIEGNDASIGLLQVRDGLLLGQERSIFPRGESIEIISFLPRYYKTATIYP